MKDDTCESGILPSILRLRNLREKLCSSNEWKMSLATVDSISEELTSLCAMLEDDKVQRKDCLNKAKSILDNISVSCQSEKEEK